LLFRQRWSLTLRLFPAPAYTGPRFTGASGRFPAQPRGDGRFGGVAFGAFAQRARPPPQPLQFLLDDPPGPGLRALALPFAGVRCTIAIPAKMIELRTMKNGKPATERIELGEYIVADPEICHGKPTFKGTRIMVWQVLEDVAEGRSWDFICNQRWGGRIPLSAIAEAIRLAQAAWLERYGLAARRAVRKHSEPAFA